MGKVLNLEREVGVPSLSLVSYMTLHFAITEYRLGGLINKNYFEPLASNLLLINKI